MNLDEQGVKTLLQHLHDKWGDKFNCPQCYKSGEFEFSDGIKIFMLTEYTGGGLVIGAGASQMPVVPIICKSCGHVSLLNTPQVPNAKEKEKDEVKPS